MWCQLFTWMNFFYKRVFCIYKAFYFCYKRFSDREKIRLIRKTVKKGMTVLDIGANIGFYSILLSRLVGPSGKVIAYEPEERNISILKKITRKRNNITVQPNACGEKTEMINLYVSKNMNIDHQTYDSGEKRTVQHVPCVAVDDDLDKEEIIGFIKIDVQGYDYYALLGMKKTIQRSRELTLIGEFWPFALKKAGVEPGEYIRLLKELGFSVHFFNTKTDPLHPEKMAEKYYYTDFYASKKSNTFL